MPGCVPGVELGYLGEVHPDVLKQMDIKNMAYIFEINLDLLNELIGGKIVYREISKFPAVVRDVAFVVRADMEAAEMLEIINGQVEDLLENVVIFDKYEGKGLEAGTKSLGLRFSYRAPDRTLTDAEISSVHEKIVQNMIKVTGAKIRS